MVPWKLPGDMAFFKQITTAVKDENKQNVVIMGRKTWESIPSKFRPLPQRINIVLSSNSTTVTDDVLVCNSLAAAMALCNGSLREKVEGVYIIGGSSLYNEAMAVASTVYWTRVLADIECDTFITPIDTTMFQVVGLCPLLFLLFFSFDCLHWFFHMLFFSHKIVCCVS